MPSFNKSRQMYQAYSPRVAGKRLHLGYFATRSDAAEAEAAYRESGTVLARDRKGHAVSSSPQRGVGWNKKRKKWQAYAYVRGRQVYIGLFDDHSEACKYVRNYHDSLSKGYTS